MQLANLGQFRARVASTIIASLCGYAGCFPIPPECGEQLACPPSDDPCVEVVCAKRECVERPTESVPCNAFDASDQGSDSNTADAESDSADGSNSDTPVDTDVTTTDTGQTTDTDTTLRSDADVANSETNDSEFPLSSETDGTGTEQQGDGFDVGPADAYPSDLAAEETFDPEVDVSERECDANSDCPGSKDLVRSGFVKRMANVFRHPGRAAATTTCRVRIAIPASAIPASAPCTNATTVRTAPTTCATAPVDA